MAESSPSWPTLEGWDLYRSRFSKWALITVDDSTLEHGISALMVRQAPWEHAIICPFCDTLASPETLMSEPSDIEQMPEPVGMSAVSAVSSSNPPGGSESATSAPPTSASQLTSGPPVPWGAAPRLGTDRAYQAVGEVAAPLLAGFSVALLGVIAQAPNMLRWPGAALLALIIAVGLLLGSVQAAFTGKQKYWTRSDLLDWYVNEPPDPLSSAFKQMHRRDIDAWLRWLNRARIAYNAGLTVLLIGVAIVLAPPRTSAGYPVSTTEAILRWVSAGVALTLASIEIMWWLRTREKGR
jgi:hypothetical protein